MGLVKFFYGLAMIGAVVAIGGFVVGLAGSHHVGLYLFGGGAAWCLLMTIFMMIVPDQ